MSEISRIEYWNEVRSLAKSMVSEELENCDGDIDMAEESINDSVLHETIDGHQWIIYNAYNDDVLRHTENEDYYQDNFGADDMAATLKDRGFDGLKTVIAFFAMYADVSEEVQKEIERLREEQDA